MKKKIDNYSFSKTAKTVTFTDYALIRLDSILLITNATDSTIIFNFADPTKGGTVTGNVLTLAFDTAAMENTDKLLIYYDDTADEVALSSNQELMQSLIETLQEATIRLSSIASLINNTAQLRVIQSSVPSTAVTGPATSAQVVAALLTQSIALERYSANAVHSNINNVTP